PPAGHRHDDTRPGPLRPRQRSPRRPPGNPRPSLPRQPEPLRQHGPAATPKTHRRLDQPAKPEAPGPSLISQTGCLIVVDTFRRGFAPDGIRVNVVTLGTIDTPLFHEGLMARGGSAESVASPLGRVG